MRKRHETITIIGTQISEDGKTIWRNNGGIIERNSLYSGKPEWEPVGGDGVPRTPDELREMCTTGGYEFVEPEEKHDCRVGAIYCEMTAEQMDEWNSGRMDDYILRDAEFFDASRDEYLQWEEICKHHGGFLEEYLEGNYAEIM